MIDTYVSISYTIYKMKLYKRDIFDKIKPFLGDETVLVIIGARQVGKTHVLDYIQKYLEEHNHKTLYYDLEFPDLLTTLNLGVDAFITDLTNKGYVAGEHIFVCIDEIQYLDNPSSFLKIIADHYKNIHLIISGSSTFDIKTKFTNSLAGRTINFELFPLNFSEFLVFKESEYKNISNPSFAGTNRIKEQYHEFVQYGGYPKITLEPNKEKKKLHLLQLVDTYVRKDIRDLADITDITKFNSMLKVLASQSGQILNVSALSRETNISQPTLHKYLSILEETFIIKRVTPYSKSPGVEISKNPKVFFLDSGLQSVLWFNDFQSTFMGTVFETNVFSELVKKYGRTAVHFWRTKTHQEIDFIVETRNIVPIEVKTNFRRFNPRAMKSFTRKYHVTDWKLIGLEGEKMSPNEFFPWEL